MWGCEDEESGKEVLPEELRYVSSGVPAHFHTMPLNSESRLFPATSRGPETFVIACTLDGISSKFVTNNGGTLRVNIKSPKMHDVFIIAFHFPSCSLSPSHARQSLQQIAESFSLV